MPTQQRNVIIDTDGGVDDALALLYLLHYSSLEHINILCITTVYGNVSLHQATVNINNIFNSLQHYTSNHIKIYCGAEYSLNKSSYDNTTWLGHGTDGLGDVDFNELMQSPQYIDHVDRSMNAFQAIITLVNEYHDKQQPIDIVAIGPLTNLALAIQSQPDLLNKINSLHVMGGSSTGKGTASLTAEFNIHCDPAAADIVFGNQYCHAANVFIYDWVLCEKHVYEWDQYNQLCNIHNNTVCNQFINKTHNVMFEHCTKHGMKFMPCDLYAVACYIHSDIIITTQQLYCEIELHGINTIGMTCMDWYGQKADKQLNITLVIDVDKPLLYQYLIDCTRPDDWPILHLHTIHSLVEKYNTKLNQLKSCIRLLKSNDTIQLQLLHRNDIHDTVHFVTQCFLRYEPMNSTLAAVGMVERNKRWQSGFNCDLIDITNAQPQHTSLVIKHNHDIIGTVVSSMHHTVQSTHNNNSTDSGADDYIGGIMTDLKKDYSPYNDNSIRILHITLLCVASEYSRCGLATLLVNTLIDIATLADYHQIVTDATTLSQDVFIKCGFHSVANIPFSDYIHNGIKPFSSITSTSKLSDIPAIHLMVYNITKNNKT